VNRPLGIIAAMRDVVKTRYSGQKVIQRSGEESAPLGDGRDRRLDMKNPRSPG